jgi:hypothetical protein
MCSIHRSSVQPRLSCSFSFFISSFLFSAPFFFSHSQLQDTNTRTCISDQINIISHEYIPQSQENNLIFFIFTTQVTRFATTQCKIHNTQVTINKINKKRMHIYLARTQELTSSQKHKFHRCADSAAALTRPKTICADT